MMSIRPTALIPSNVTDVSSNSAVYSNLIVWNCCHIVIINSVIIIVIIIIVVINII